MRHKITTSLKGNYQTIEADRTVYIINGVEIVIYVVHNGDQEVLVISGDGNLNVHPRAANMIYVDCTK